MEIELKDIYYKDKLYNFNYKFVQGKVTAIMGDNPSNSLIASIIMGQVRDFYGSVLVDGLYNYDKHSFYKNIGYVSACPVNQFVCSIVKDEIIMKLKKFNYKNINNIIIAINIFLAIDCIISAYAIDLFKIRMIVNYDLNVTNKNSIIKINQKIEQNKLNQKLTNTIFCDKIMLKTYPNLKVQCLDGSMIYFKDLLPDIKPYYLRLQEKDFYK